MDIQLALRPLEDLECRLSSFYEWLSTVFVGDAEAASLFYRLARDEKAHVALIQYERRMLRRSPRGIHLQMEVEAIFDLLKKIEAVRKAPSPPSLGEAVRMALEIENSGAENHYKGAQGGLKDTLAQLLSNLGKEDARHYGALLKFAKGRGFPIPEEEKVT